MAVEPVEGGYRLIERNCPFINTAMNRPSLCSVSVNALTKVLGVRVAREEKFQNGDGRCVFRVYADEPVDATTMEFRLESEM
jgi:predicted ArsR family transcriptional regulator